MQTSQGQGKYIHALEEKQHSGPGGKETFNNWNFILAHRLLPLDEVSGGR